MPEYEFQLSDYRRIVLRQFKFIFIVITIAAIAGLIASRKIPRYYQAVAVVKADFRLFFEGADVGGALTGALEENLGSMMIDITSYAVVLDAAKKIGSISDTLSMQTLLADQKSIATMEQLRENITCTPGTVPQTIRICVKSKSAENAARIANALALAYQHFAYSCKKAFFDQKEQYIVTMLDRCKEQLAQQGERMVAARAESKGLIDEDYRHKQDKKLSLFELQMARIDNLTEVTAALRNDIGSIIARIQRPTTDATIDTAGLLPDCNWISQLASRDAALFHLNRRLMELNERRSAYSRFYTQRHPALRAVNDQMLVTLHKMGELLIGTANTLERDRAALVAKTDVINGRLREQPGDENAVEWLQRGYDLQTHACEDIEAQLTEVHLLLEGLVPYVSIVNEAARPAAPTGIGGSKITLIAAAAGFILALILSIFREMADRSLGTVDDVRRVITQYPVLTVIPAFAKGNRRRRDRNSIAVFERASTSLLPVLFAPEEAQSEPFRVLAARVATEQRERSSSLILVTSSTIQEGKTVVAANLALALASLGKQTLLLEADFRRPALAALFGIPHGTGFANVLIEAVPPAACICTVTDLILGKYGWDLCYSRHGVRNLNLMLHGALPPNPGELFTSEIMTKVVEQLRGDYDYIIADCPPVTTVSDVASLARHADGAVMVYRSDGAPRELLVTGVAILEKSAIPLLGLALNCWHDVSMLEGDD